MSNNNFTPYERWEFTLLPYTYREHVLPKELMLDFDSYILYLRNQEDTENIQLLFREFENHHKLTNNLHKVNKDQIGLNKVINKKQLTLEDFKNHLEVKNPHNLNRYKLDIDKLKNYKPSTIADVDNLSEESYLTAQQLKYYLDSYVYRLKNYKQLILDVVPNIAEAKMNIDNKWRYGTHYNIMINEQYDYEISCEGYYRKFGKISIKDNHTERIELTKLANSETLVRLPLVSLSDKGGFGIGPNNNIVSWGERDNILVTNSPPGTNFTQIHSNKENSIVITKTNSLFIWGDPTTIIAENMPEDKTFSRIALSDELCVGIEWDGSIEVWGNTTYDIFKSKPQFGEYKEVSVGLDHAVCIREDGSLLAWGNNERNQLDGVPKGNDFVQVSCGEYHTIALKRDGSVLAWGDNTHNQLSNIPPSKDNIFVTATETNNIMINKDGALEFTKTGTPNAINRPKEKSYVQVISRNGTCVALRYDGSVSIWGEDKDSPLIKNVPTDRVFKDI